MFFTIFFTIELIKKLLYNFYRLSRCTIDDMKPPDPCLARLPTYSCLEYKQDKSLFTASVVNKNLKPMIKRSDSAKHRKPSINVKGDFSRGLTCDEFVLKPGDNTFVVTRRVDQPGVYKVGQLSLVVEDKLEFLSPILNPRLSYEVAKTQPIIFLQCTRDLLAGLPQEIELVISSGSVKITEDAKLKLRSSRGLTLQGVENGHVMVREVDVALPSCEPFQNTTLALKVMAELPPKKDASTIEHKVMN